MSKEATEPQTTQEFELAERCERHQGSGWRCDREVLPESLVPVYVGNHEQQWCPGCVEEVTGLDYAQFRNRQQSVWRYVDERTISAFLVGVALTMLFMSMFTV